MLTVTQQRAIRSNEYGYDDAPNVPSETFASHIAKPFDKACPPKKSADEISCNFPHLIALLSATRA